MQRYHVNYKLLVTLVVGGVLLAGGLYGLYQYQYLRGAEKLLTQSEEALAEGDLLKAGNYLLQYTRIHRDDEQRIHQMGQIFADIGEDPEFEPSDRSRAIGLVEAAVRSIPKDRKLRQRLVDLRIAVGGYKEAGEHLEMMVLENPNDADLLSQLVLCQLNTQQNEDGLKICSKIVGYDPVLGDFSDDAPAVDRHKVEAYGQLAALVARTSSNEEDIERIIERSVEVNPENAQAYIARGQFYLNKGEERKEDAIADIEKAIELDPTDSNGLLLRARLYARDEDYEKARGLVERGIQSDPTNGSFYLTRADIAQREEGVDASLDWLAKGVEATTSGTQVHLKVAQARALINAGKIDKSKQLIEEFSKLPYFSKTMVEYLRARVMVAEFQWHSAAQSLAKLRPEMSQSYELNEELNIMLALCYIRLEQWERAEDAAGQVLQLNPKNRMARDFLNTALGKLGRDSIDGSVLSINDLVKDELKKAEGSRDWDVVLAKVREYAEEQVEKGNMTESSKKLVLAEVLMRSKDFKQASKLVRQAISDDPDNMNTWRLACRLTTADPDGGAVKGMKMLDKVVEKFGDSPVLRLDRADMYMTINDEDVIQQMLSVTEGAEDTPVQEQVMLWKGLASRFEILRAADALETARDKVANLAPNELPNLLDLFLAARAANNDAQMASSQDRILKVVGSKQDPNWLYTEAHRLISLYQRKLAGKEALDQAEELIKRAQEERQDWHMLYLLLADLAVQRGDAVAALENLDRASELGPPTASSLMQHVSLLMRRGRFDDARQQMDRAPAKFRDRLLSRQYAECLLKSRFLGERDKRYDESVAAAMKAGELAPENGATQLWLGRFLLTASRSDKLTEDLREQAMEDSGIAFQKAVELLPKSQEAWLSYVAYLAKTGRQAAADASDDTDSPDVASVGQAKINQARDVVRQMQLALDEDVLPLALGAGYEILGRWFDAENVYRLALEANPDDLSIKRSLASLYLGGAYPLEDKLEKATPLVNSLLRQAADNPELSTEANVLWARRTAAKLLAKTGDYQKALDAERLISSNIVNGQLTSGDRLLLAQMLATRPEPLSKLRAVALYESITEIQDLSPYDQLALGQLYYATKQWEKCQRLMIELISRSPSSVTARDSYIRMLLDHNEGRDLADAARQLKRLQEFAPTAPSTLELLVRISTKLGREQEVIPVLRELLSRDENRRNPEVIARVATLLADLGDLENAEKLFRVAAKMNPRYNLSLANFLGNHRDMDAALNLYDQAAGELGVFATIQYANTTLKSQAESLEPRHLERVEGWLKRALREDPESIRLLMQQATLYDIKKQYGAAADIYRGLLDREELQGVQRAVVLNNLAYQVAMSSSEQAAFEESIGYVAEAADILGPQSDILDTRAVVYMQLGQAKEAVADMELAVTDNPTDSKYFHLARALMLDRQPSKAVEAWDKAMEMGLSPNDIGVAEREGYRELEAKIKRLKQSAQPKEADAAA